MLEMLRPCLKAEGLSAKNLTKREEPEDHGKPQEPFRDDRNRYTL